MYNLCYEIAGTSFCLCIYNHPRTVLSAGQFSLPLTAFFTWLGCGWNMTTAVFWKAGHANSQDIDSVGIFGNQRPRLQYIKKAVRLDFHNDLTSKRGALCNDSVWRMAFHVQGSCV